MHHKFRLALVTRHANEAMRCESWGEQVEYGSDLGPSLWRFIRKLFIILLKNFLCALHSSRTLRRASFALWPATHAPQLPSATWTTARPVAGDSRAIWVAKLYDRVCQSVGIVAAVAHGHEPCHRNCSCQPSARGPWFWFMPEISIRMCPSWKTDCHMIKMHGKQCNV